MARGQPQRPRYGRLVQSVPRRRLPAVQGPVADVFGIGPVARGVVPEVPQDVGSVRFRMGRDLVYGRAAQRHERHLRRTEVGALRVPLGSDRDRQG